MTGGQNVIGLKSLAKDLGISVKLALATDSSAAQAVLQRRGINKLRHLHTKSLWIQQAVQNKLFSVFKVKGTKNVADIGTKFLDGQRIDALMESMGFVYKSGRSKIQKAAQI